MAVSCLASVANLGLVLKDNDFLAPAVPLRRSQYLRPVNNRLTDCYLVAIGDKQHPVQFDSAALNRTQMLRIYGLAFGYLILLATGFNNSVNFEPPRLVLYQLVELCVKRWFRWFYLHLVAGFFSPLPPPFHIYSRPPPSIISGLSRKCTPHLLD